MLNNQALDTFARQPNRLDVEIEELDPIQRTFPQDGIIVTIFQRLRDGDKLSFAEASPYTRKTLAKYIQSIPASIRMEDVNKYNNAVAELQKMKEIQSCYERHCPKCPQACYNNDFIKGCHIVGKLTALVSSIASVVTGISTCCKAKAACSSCVGTKISCAIASGSTGGTAVLILCCVLGISTSWYIEHEVETAADQVKQKERTRQYQIDQLNEATRFPRLSAVQPELLKMDDKARNEQRERIRKNYSIPTEPTERSKLLPGHIQMTDE